MRNIAIMLLSCLCVSIQLAQASTYSEAIARGTEAYGHRDYDLAEKSFLSALQADPKSGHETLEQAEALNDLGVIYQETGRNSQAEEAYKRALAIREKLLGPNDMAVSVTLNNMANYYKDLKNYSAAEKCYKRSIDIALQREGSKSPDLIRDYYNFASLYADENKYVEAVPLLKRSIELCEKSDDSAGRAHIKEIIYNLAIAYDSLGQKAQAKPLFKRYLDIVIAGPSAGLSDTERVLKANEFITVLRKGHDDYDADLLEKALEVCTDQK